MPANFTTMGRFDSAIEGGSYEEAEVLMASSAPTCTTDQGEMIRLLQPKFQPDGHKRIRF